MSTPAAPLPPDPSIAAAKKSSRQAMKRRLAALEFNRLTAAAQIFRNLERLPEFRDAQTLAVYLDFRDEAPTTPFLPRLFDRPERVVAAPRCVERELEFYRLDAPRVLDAPPSDADFVDRDAFAPERLFRFDALTSGAFGIWEPLPVPERLVPAARFDVVLVPGLAFDLDGGRL
ncbi:MAG: hypothetical protein IJY15_01590, partial [Thermoguttaceae bacterium]|nr:hypothetical protein [Thermoguttaceae bacterium]